MIINNPILKNFEKEWIQNNPSNYKRNLRYFEALFKEAQLLGVFPLKNPLEGIEVDIRLAQSLNYVRKTSVKNRHGS